LLNLYAIAAVLMGCGALVGFLIHNSLKPKHYFRVWTPGGGEVAKKLKRLGGTFTWVDPDDGRRIQFPLLSEYARRTKNGGLRFTGDAKTGLLMRYNTDTGAFEHLDPKYLMASFDSGREQKLAQSLGNGQPWYAQYVLIGAILFGVIACATLYFVYQLWKHQSHGGT